MAGKAQGMKIWQKMIALIALAFALVIFVDGFSIVSRAETGTTNNAVNMRKTPSKNGDLVKKLEKGTQVEILGEVDGKDGDGKKWYEVKVGNSTGYIRSDLIKKGAANGGGNEETTTTVTTNEVEAVTPVGATIAGSNTVRVRTSADTNTSNNILTTAAKGTEVTVIGKTVGTDKKTWYQVKLKVDGKDVVGYVRSDYLALTGEIKPFEADVPEETVVDDNPPEETTPSIPEDNEPKKRYETKLINDEWWILDYEKSEQYKIEQLFSAAEEYKTLYEATKKKTKSQKGWIVILIVLLIAAGSAVGYLLYRFKEVKEDAFIASIENNTPKRTAERPRAEARGGSQSGAKERPAIKEGLEPRSREENQRPANGQRSTGNRQQQGQPQRPANPGQGQQRQGQPGQGQQRPSNNGNGQPQRPANPGQGQQRQGGQPGQGQPQRPANPGQGQRPVNPGQAQRQGGQPGQGRPNANPQPQQPQVRSKNFVQDGDDMEFEFLNWDSDE